jgi:hypothetical protein
VENIRYNILNGLIGNGGAPARAEFDKYLAAYTAGHYVINRDWQTELQGSAIALDSDHAAVKTFTDARAVLNDNTKYPTIPTVTAAGEEQIFRLAVITR